MLNVIALMLSLQEATLRGTVEVGHRVPPPRTLRLRADPKAEAMHPQGLLSEELAVDSRNGLKWAFVHVKRGHEGRSYPVPVRPVLLEYDGFVLKPRTLGMMPGQELLIRNRDNVLHTWHALPFVNKEIHFGMPTPGVEERRSFKLPELMFRGKCDIHPWEECRLNVIPHPFFAVTDERGRYEIRGLPPGRYTIEVLHEKCIPVEHEIVVMAGEARELDFAVATKDGPPPREWKPFLIAGAAFAAVLAFLGLLLLRRPRPRTA